MSRCIVFLVDGYAQSVAALQPWLTIGKVAQYLCKEGWQAHLVTNARDAASVADMDVHIVDSLRTSNPAQITPLLQRIVPDITVCLVTPLSLVRTGWLGDVPGRLYAFVSYPFYTRAELLRAKPHIPLREYAQYARHAFVPRWLWSRNLTRWFDGVIAQSQRTAHRAAAGKVSAHAIPSGLDLEYWTPAERGESTGRMLQLLYVGSIRPIRGYQVLLDVLSQIDASSWRLSVLARGSDSVQIAELEQDIAIRLGAAASNVVVTSGWMDRDSYRDAIREADAVVLPFVLVPSELPVSVIECIACGTPVLTTDIDGLPEAVADAGLVVDAGSVEALRQGLLRLINEPSLLTALRRHCTLHRERMLDWDAVAASWMREFLT